MPLSGLSDDDFDPYRELQLSPEAEPELIKAAFKTLAKKYHPDNFPDPSEKARAEERMRRINEAQNLIQSGRARRPSSPTPPEASQRNSLVVQDSQPTRSPAAAENSGKEKRPPSKKEMGFAPVAVALLVLVLCLVVPRFLGRDSLQKAQELEQQGRLAEALEQANVAIERDPRNGRAYLFRSALYSKLGQPERAQTDLANARGLVSTQEFEASQHDFLTPSPTPTGQPGKES